MRKLVKFGERTLVLSPLVQPEITLPDQAYIVLLPAFNKSEHIASLKIARSYMSILCKELCLVGTEAAKLEDEIDAALEMTELFIPTVAVLKADDACEYFLFGADAGIAQYLFAPIEEHQGLCKTLITKINSSSMT